MRIEQQFASDNNAGMCPEAVAALLEANATPHAPAYGDDEWTERARAAIRGLLDAPEAAVFFVFNGTAANSLALAHLCRPYHAVIAHEASHIATDEAGAPGFFAGGAWLKTASGQGGKLAPSDIEALTSGRRGVHNVKPRALSLTQATELGTVYAAGEVEVLCTAAKAAGLAVQMDGARLANAIATLSCKPAAVTWRAGVDVLSLGGVKNGLGVGEAIVVFDAAVGHEFEWRIKQAGHLNAKMRLITAPWTALIESGAWLRNAQHANAMAQRLAAGLQGLERVRLAYPVEANAVFADMPVPVQTTMRTKGWRFYTFAGDTVCRLMCAWDTTSETVDRFCNDLRAAVRTASCKRNE